MTSATVSRSSLHGFNVAKASRLLAGPLSIGLQKTGCLANRRLLLTDRNRYMIGNWANSAFCHAQLD